MSGTTLDVGTISGKIEYDVRPADNALTYMQRQLATFSQTAGRQGTAAGQQFGGQFSARATAAIQTFAAGATGSTLGQRLGQQAAPGVARGVQQGAQQGAAQAGASGQRLGQQMGQQAQQGLAQGVRQGAQQGAAQAGSAGTQLGNQMGNQAQQGVRAGVAQGAQQGASQAAGAGGQLGNRLGQAAAPGVQQGVAQGAKAGAQAGAKEGSALGSKMGELVAASIAGAGIGKALSAAFEAQDQSHKLQAQLGLSADDVKRYTQAAGQVFRDNWAESTTEATDDISHVVAAIQGLKGASDSDIVSITEQIKAMSSAFGDQGASVETISQDLSKMLSAGIVSNAQEGLDLLTTGLQKTRGKADDLLDTFNEYPVQFAKAGIDGKTAMGLISQAVNAGARDTDVAADSIKEMGIQLLDTGSNAAKGLQMLGLNAQQVIGEFRQGGPHAAAALQMIFDKVRENGGALKNMGALTNLASSQIEDLGHAFDAMNANTAAQDLGQVAGAAQQVTDVMGNSATNSLAGFWHNLQSVGQTIGTELLPVVTPLVDWVGKLGGVVGDAVKWFVSLPAPLRDTALAIGAVVAFRGPLMAVAGGFKAVWNEARNLGTGSGWVAGNLDKIGKAIGVGGAIAGGIFIFNEISKSMDRIKTSEAELASETQSLTDALVANGGQWNDQIRDQQRAQIAQSDAFKLLVSRGANFNDLMDLATGKTDQWTKSIADAFGTLSKSEADGVIPWINGISQSGAAAQKSAQDLLAYNSMQDTLAQVAAQGTQAMSENSRAVQDQAEAAKAAAAAEQARYRALHDTGAEVGKAVTSMGEHSGAAQADAAAMSSLINAQDRGATSLAHTGEVLAALGGAYAAHRTALERIAKPLAAVYGGSDRAKEGFDAAGFAAGLAASTFSQAAKALQDQSDATDKANRRLQIFTATINQSLGVSVTTQQATKDLNDQVRNMADAFKAGTDATKGNIESLITANGVIDTATEAGSKLYDSVWSFRGAYDEASSAAYNQAKATGTAADALKAGRAAADAARAKFLDQAAALGINREAAEKMADAVGILEGKKLTPKNFAIDASDNATPVLDAVAAKAAAFDGKTYTAKVVVEGASSGNLIVRTGGSQAKAGGGRVWGPGSGTSDDIPVWLSNGEGVNTAAAMNHPENVRAMHFMNSGGVIPGFASGGRVMVDVLGRLGPLSSALSQMDGDVAGATSSTPAPMAGVPAASSAGVQQWAQIFTQALIMTGQFTQANLAAGLYQMQTESSGNPAAINLYDINAQNGVPSKGLMQVIDPTFRSYAFPGYDQNIWDPLSNILASIRYTIAAYGSLLNGWQGHAYAGGGLVSGPGSGRSDSILARVSNGEGINTAAAMAHPENRAAMFFMNAGGIVPGFANGGLALPSASALAGVAAPSYSGRTGNYFTAWGQLSQAVGDVWSSVANLTGKARQQALLHAQALSAELKAMQPLLNAQTRLATAYDTTAASLADASSKLTDLQNQRASAASSIAGTIAGYDSGILGHTAQRTTVADIIGGLRFDAGKVDAFGGSLSRLSSLGLSPALLSQLANAGIDTAGGTASILAGASKAQIAQINAMQARINTSAAKTGTLVAGREYDTAIRAATAQERALTTKLGDLDRTMRVLAGAVNHSIAQTDAGLKVDINPQGVARLVAIGNKQLARR